MEIMNIIITGRVTQVILLILFCIIAVYFTKTLPKTPGIRRVPALDAIDECVGRATEMGRPIHISSGNPNVIGSGDTQTMAGLSVLNYVADLCASRDARIIDTSYKAEQQVMQQDIIKSAFTKHGKLENYNPNDSYFFSGTAYAPGIIGVIEDERCVANIIIGNFHGNFALAFMPYAFRGDVIQIGGTSNVTNLPHMAALVDYLVIAEEMFAMDAYLTKDKNKLSVLYGAEIIKYGILAWISIGAFSYAFGLKILADIIHM